MIVFNLCCSNEHRFEGWFASAADFEKQRESRLLSCPLCASDEVRKELHAPYVNTGGSPEAQATQKSQPKEHPAQYTNAGAELVQLIEKLIANTEDVGRQFPEEARKIHYRESPERHIRGNASPEEINELREEGIDVVALPVPRHLLGNRH